MLVHIKTIKVLFDLNEANQYIKLFKEENEDYLYNGFGEDFPLVLENKKWIEKFESSKILNEDTKRIHWQLRSMILEKSDLDKLLNLTRNYGEKVLTEILEMALKNNYFLR